MWKRGESLVVDHTVLCEKDDADGGEWVTKEDVVHHTWQPIVG